MEVFNKVVLFNLNQTDRENNLITIEPTTEDYLLNVNCIDVPCEYISGKQIKPCFDVEIYIENGFVYEEPIQIAKINKDIQKVLKLDTSKKKFTFLKENSEK